MEESLPPPTRGPVVRVLEALIVAAVVAWVLDLPGTLGLTLYTEQLLLFVLGVAIALAFLVFPARLGSKRVAAPWWDYVAGAVALGICTWLAIGYEDLVSDIAMSPGRYLPMATVLVLLVVETTRRSTGMSLIWYTIIGFIYALWGHFIPGVFAAQNVSFTRLVTYLGLDSNALLGSSLQVAVLVVIPFILLGQILSRCGGSEFFTDLSMALMGRYRGGAGKVAVTGSALFGMISGSAVANVSAVGVVTIPLMKRSGFPPIFAASVEAVGSTGGQLMPPVMGAAAFLMAEYLQVPYSAVVVAATIPAFLYYLSLFIQVDIEAASRGIMGTPMNRLPALMEVLREGWHFILPFAVIVVGLLAYNMEAEYAAMIAVAVLIGCCFIFRYRGRRMSVKEMVFAILSTGSAVLDITLICAAAGILIGILNISGLAFGLTLELVGLSGNNLAIMLLIAAVVGIVLGLGLPTVGVYVLMATLVAPSLVKLGVSPMAAHMFVMYFGMMSMVTPPIALAAYAAANIAQCDPDKTGWMATRVGWASYVVPFLFVFNPLLLMDGSWFAILWALSTNALGLWCGTIAVVGYYTTRIAVPFRVAFAATALALLFPTQGGDTGILVNLLGAAGAAILLGRPWFAQLRAAPPSNSRSERSESA